MKKSFICHPVSKRQVWKEFSQVTEALGNVSWWETQGCKTQDVLTLGESGGQEKEIKHPPPQAFQEPSGGRIQGYKQKGKRVALGVEKG